jgi:hypothetical protein
LRVPGRARSLQLEEENPDLRAETAVLKRRQPSSLGSASVGQIRVCRLCPQQDLQHESCVEIVLLIAGLAVKFLPLAMSRRFSHGYPASSGYRGVHRFIKDSDGTCGYRCIQTKLVEDNTEVCPEPVSQMILEEGLSACQPRSSRLPPKGASMRLVRHRSHAHRTHRKPIEERRCDERHRT